MKISKAEMSAIKMMIAYMRKPLPEDQPKDKRLLGLPAYEDKESFIHLADLARINNDQGREED